MGGSRLHCSFQQEGRDLHRACVRLFGEFLELFQCLRGKPDKPLLIPRRIGRTPTTFRRPETRCHFCCELDCPEVAAGDETLPRFSAPNSLAMRSMSKDGFMTYSSPNSRNARYSSPITIPISPWCASRPIFRQKLPSWRRRPESAIASGVV